MVNYLIMELKLNDNHLIGFGNEIRVQRNRIPAASAAVERIACPFAHSQFLFFIFSYYIYIYRGNK